MITDRLSNIHKYSEISKNVSDFLESLTQDTPTGHYEIDENSFANIDEYNTKPIEICKFEAHKKYIDIQMLLDGKEQLDYLPFDNLKVSEEYDEKRDVMFFENTSETIDSITLEPFKFAFIYPHEAHKPQISTNTPQRVKKVVVKILAK